MLGFGLRGGNVGILRWVLSGFPWVPARGNAVYIRMSLKSRHTTRMNCLFFLHIVEAALRSCDGFRVGSYEFRHSPGREAHVDEARREG